ncbi:MAG TPA: hypothetical protein VLH85_07560 [Levilinea sp.]|nr:hypothetical protein [Levilinea sp.]
MFATALALILMTAGCVTLPDQEVTPGEEVAEPFPLVSLTLPPGTPAPNPTLSPTPAPTITPSITPSPTITLVPTITPIPGWSLIHGDGVSLWLPDSWRGGNLQQDLDQFLADVAGEAAVIQQYAAVLEQNREVINLWAFDSGTTGHFHLTNVNIGREEVGDQVTVDIYIDAINRNLPENFTITGRDVQMIHGIPGGSIDVDVLLNGLLIRQIMYILKVDNVMWLVTFAATYDTFDAYLAIIEQSMQTLEIEQRVMGDE